MGATFQGLDIAKSGMMAYNASMQTAAHNLANVGTKGYSRQVVKTAAQTRHVSSIKVEGSGVYVQGIVREHNDYYDVKYCKSNATYYKYNTHSYFLNDVQKVLYAKDEKQAGITTSFDEFCKRLTGTSTDAGSETRRKEIVSYAETFSGFVQETATNLKSLQEEANEKIKTTVEQINAIAEKPLWGYGGGSFPYVYGEAQKEYFSKGLYSQTEEFVAGSPFYAFNEYLQMSVEWGIPFLIAYLSLMVYTIYVGMKNKRYGICAGLLSLSVFAFFSYPFQILAFGVMMILLLSACLETRRTDNKMTIALSKRYRYVLLVLLLIGNVFICIKLYPATKITEHWILAKLLFKEKRYETLEAENQYLYSYLKHNNEFLMLFAQGLYKQKKYKECIIVLHRGQKLSSHPYLRILEGECNRSMGQFEETERCFKDAVWLLPGRIYPYYLLAKLYASPEYLHPEEFEKMKHIVLTKKPKVDSEAIDKMKEEVTKIKVQTIKKQMSYD